MIIEFFVFICERIILIFSEVIMRRRPVMPNPKAIIVRFEKIDSKIFLKRKPIIAAGIVAIIIRRPNLAFCVLNFSSKKSCRIFVMSLPK